MPRRAGPSARSRRLARSLRRIRAERGLSAAEVAKALGMSGSKINRVETCEIGIYLDDLERLLDYYRLPAERRVELLDIARHAEQRSWLRTRNAHFPADWQTWSDFEDEATGLRQYEPLTIPGLLQTPEYARSVIAATGGALSGDEVDDLVAHRMARQQLLSRRSPFNLHVILEECVLVRNFHTHGCGARQLRHIAHEAERENVIVQIVPANVGIHAGMAGAFILLDYGQDPCSVWLEQLVSSLFLDDEEHVEMYQATWENLVHVALDPEQSRDRLRQMAVLESAETEIMPS
ncbi:helix-turn-helix domain-containing protein [Saccharopolyspora gregorii]|uniref:helix-turn-helix domain-containing protein n=1 Tax=Saccharopolyspora gregorii TaxID=33914 RepID=UPI0021AC663E|nr:helix-turn-helix transcriptional regulator [Saccharopolyspora gregorii]